MKRPTEPLAYQYSTVDTYRIYFREYPIDRFLTVLARTCMYVQKKCYCCWIAAILTPYILFRVTNIHIGTATN